MNPRIREIIAQLGGVGRDEDGTELTPSLVGKNLEKFAELIVHECLAFVEPSSYHKAYPDNMLGGVDGLELLYNRAERIREHFDV